jgi:hypothetical protein
MKRISRLFLVLAPYEVSLKKSYVENMFLKAGCAYLMIWPPLPG